MDKPSLSDAALQARLNLLAGVLRLGHEAFDQPDLPCLGNHIVNNSRLLSRYDRSTLIECKGKNARILAISGQSEVNPHSEFAKQIITFVASLPNSTSQESYVLADNKELSELLTQSLTDICPAGRIFVLPLVFPKSCAVQSTRILWVVEFFDGCNSSEGNSLGLLAKHYGQSLALLMRPEREKRFFSKHFSKWSLKEKSAIVVSLIVACLFLVRVPLSTLAECELIPAQRYIAYAPVTGIIDRSRLQDGASVQSSDVVLVYDKQEFLFNLTEAIRTRQEIEAELDVLRQKSFSSAGDLGQVKLLEARRQKSEVAVEKQQWILDRSEIHSQINGILRITEPETFAGRAVTVGEKLFEVIEPGNVLLRITLPENEGSILSELKPDISFFLHSKPEQRLSAHIVSTGTKPLPTEEGKIGYLIKARPEQNTALITGLRGMARLRGNNIMLINYLGRNLVLWWRKL